jgi:hypothetical protein
VAGRNRPRPRQSVLASTDVTNRDVSAKIESSVTRKCSAKTHPLEDEDDYDSGKDGPPSSYAILLSYLCVLCALCARPLSFRGPIPAPSPIAKSFPA